MDRTRLFRRALLVKLARASAISLPVALTFSWAACVPRGGPGNVETCYAPTDLGVAGPFSSVADCPSMDQADTLLNATYNGCGSIQSEPTFKAGSCCYEVAQCGTGRPYMDGAASRVASPARAETGAVAWSAIHEAQLTDVAPELRARIAAAWLADGLLEHASIASFGRFALELMAISAPADLIADAHRAAIDEVEHARLCFGLAQAYGAEATTPSPFPFAGRVEVSSNLADVAARAVREGCIGETIGAIQAAEQLAHADNPLVRRALGVIVEDEARHAELSWRFVAWALAHGGGDVRSAVAAAFREPLAVPTIGDDAISAEMTAHGRLDPTVLREVVQRALDEVVLPCATQLLGPRAPTIFQSDFGNRLSFGEAPVST